MATNKGHWHHNPRGVPPWLGESIELLGKREAQVHHLCEKLELLHLATLIKTHPKDLRPVLVYDPNQQLSAESFLKEVETIEPRSPSHKEIYRFFRNYVVSRQSTGNEQ